MERTDKLFPDGMDYAYLVLTDDRIAIASNLALEQYGYASNELVGKPFVEIVAPEVRQQVLDVYRKRPTRKGLLERYETVLLARDGTRSPVRVSAWLDREGGRTTGISLVADMKVVEEVQASRRQLQQALRFYAGHVVKAQEEERRRMARDLHDDTIQELLLVCARLHEVANGSYGRLPKRAQKQLEGVRVFVERTIDEVRSFTRDLRPPVLDDMGLVPALRWIAGRLANEDGLTTEVRVVGNQRRLTDDTESALFRIAQEALSNVRRHATATNTTATLEFGTEQVVLSISDNGRGFELPANVTDFASQGKLGLLGLTERVHSIGGECTIESEPGNGTVVQVRITA